MLLSLVACKNQQDETQNGEQTPTMPTEDKIQYYDSPQYSSETLNVDYLKNNDYFRVVSEENSNIEKYFIDIVSCADMGKGKDEPDVYLKALEVLGTSIDNTWIFEDSHVAIKTAAALGMKTVGIYDKNN